MPPAASSLPVSSTCSASPNFSPARQSLHQQTRARHHTEITGEGGSIAPQNEKTIASLKPMLDHYKLTLDWTTLDQYVRRLEKKGTPLNIGTYVGSAQIAKP